jgi:Phage tail sheath protein subtilisin-like domain/Phage tail sheath C-terminal domain
MAFQISPGVQVSEVDLTTVIPSVLTTAGAFVGTFKWGPADKVKLIDNEINLVKTFGKPDTTSAVSFFTAANFLAYGNNLSLVRAVGSAAMNASANTAVLIKNEDIFQAAYLNTNNADTYGGFVARYPGALGNAIKVSVCANSATYSTWTYKSYFPSAPGTSDFASSVGGSDDEMHIIVIDDTGEISGSAGSVLETFSFVSKASDAAVNGQSNYYKQVIFDQSSFVFATSPVDYSTTNATWDQTAANTSFATPATNITLSLSGGADSSPSAANVQSGFDLFSNKDSTDISLVLTGDSSVATQQYVIDNIANSRKDCVAFVSPRYSDVVNQAGSETTNIQSWLTSLGRSSSYVVADSGWKYQFDKYNNVYRWIPLNADIAGLCVFTDSIRDPWFSPAGLSRGAIKNSIKLAWNPSKTFRDTLYAAGVNPVVSFPGQGTVLFGDKTLQSKPSAFDRINVRRLFITLEKAISQAAQFSLFELNDEFTRAQFVSLITPFLRDVQGRRGIVDFKVVCDTTNNTPQVIDGNQFVGDIYIKPARSINYIQLNFVAVATGVDFNTIVGAA